MSSILILLGSNRFLRISGVGESGGKGVVTEAMAAFSVSRLLLRGMISQPTKLAISPAAVRYDQAFTVISEQLSVSSDLLLVEQFDVWIKCKLLTVDGILTIVGAIDNAGVLFSKWRSPELLSGNL